MTKPYYISYLFHRLQQLNAHTYRHTTEEEEAQEQLSKVTVDYIN